MQRMLPFALLLALGSPLTCVVAAERPNILLIVADDLGFSDAGAYGGEISTPNIDQLAAEGLQFTNFHVAATCSPTRSMLMTGVDNHLVGMGNMKEIMADNQKGKPGYEGWWNDSVVPCRACCRTRATAPTWRASGTWAHGRRAYRWRAVLTALLP